LEVTVDGDSKKLITAGFVRNGRALYAYWLPADLLEPFQPETISLQLSVPAHASIENPVLVDPLSQQVHAIQGAHANADKLVLAALPAFDYPLIITDRSVVPMVS
jgi:hypothetical protein